MDAFTPALPVDLVRSKRLETLLSLVQQLLQDAKGDPGQPGRPGPAGIQGVTGTPGAMSLISTQTLSGAAATITFSSIASTFTHLKLVGMGRISGGVVSDTIGLRFNSDSGANYCYEQTLMSASGPASPGGVAAAAQIVIVFFPGASATAGTCGTFEVVVPAYAGTTFNKNVMSVGFIATGTTTSTQFIEDNRGQWVSTAAITRIDLFVSGGSNFIAGSVFSLYGIL